MAAGGYWWERSSRPPDLTPSEREISLSIWDSIRSDCLNQFDNTYRGLIGTLDNWSLMVKTSREAFVSSLTDADREIDAASSCIDKFIEQYPFNRDLSNNISQPYRDSTRRAIQNFSQSIDGLPLTLPADYEMGLRLHVGKLKDELDHLGRWIAATRETATSKIKKLSGAS
jgi:hypothetical protein